MPTNRPSEVTFTTREFPVSAMNTSPQASTAKPFMFQLSKAEEAARDPGGGMPAPLIPVPASRVRIPLLRFSTRTCALISPMYRAVTWSGESASDRGPPAAKSALPDGIPTPTPMPASPAHTPQRPANTPAKPPLTFLTTQFPDSAMYRVLVAELQTAAAGLTKPILAAGTFVSF